MTYTAQNIANIKRDGKMDDYIAMERQLIDNLKNATLVETGDDGEGRMQFAHIYGTWSAGEDFINAEGGVWASDVKCDFGDFRKEWKNFQSMNAARQYARAALRNHISAFAATVLADAKGRLASLEAATEKAQ